MERIPRIALLHTSEKPTSWQNSPEWKRVIETQQRVLRKYPGTRISTMQYNDGEVIGNFLVFQLGTDFTPNTNGIIEFPTDRVANVMKYISGLRTSERTGQCREVSFTIQHYKGGDSRFYISPDHDRPNIRGSVGDHEIAGMVLGYNTNWGEMYALFDGTFPPATDQQKEEGMPCGIIVFAATKSKVNDGGKTIAMILAEEIYGGIPQQERPLF